jgi:IclR family pca regulon transcriptional regulator
MAQDVKQDGKSVVQSVAKCFQVLEAFTEKENELTLSQIAARAELDRGTVFRFLNTLVMLGYVERIADTKRFRLTLKVLDLGFTAIARSELRDVARPVMQGLVGEVNEAASLGVLDGSDIVYVERVQAGLTRLGVDIRVGSRIPAYCTAIGQSFLALLPRDRQIEIFESRDRVRLTPRTPVDLPDFLALLENVAETGYAVADQEVAGLRVLARAITDDDGWPVAALSVAAPVFEMALDDFIHRAAAPLTVAADTISKAMRVSGGRSVPVNRTIV